MKNSFWLTLVVLSISVIIVACGTDNTSSGPQKQEGVEQPESNDQINEGEVVALNVKAKNFSFDQAEYVVPLGTTVEIT